MKEPSKMTATERVKELSSLLAEALQRGIEKLEKEENPNHFTSSTGLYNLSKRSCERNKERSFRE